MISSTTPYKLSEIIRDTWPQLHKPSKDTEQTDESSKDLRTNM